jgi:alpha-galactosidase
MKIILLAGIILFLMHMQMAQAQTIYPEPPNQPARVEQDPARGKVRLHYDGRTILELDVKVQTPEGVKGTEELGIPWIGQIPDPLEKTALLVRSRVAREECDFILQQLELELLGAPPGFRLKLDGTVHASAEAFPAETLGFPQERFPLVRNSVGPSRNLRNNAVYDRRYDWVLYGPDSGPLDESMLIGLQESSKENRLFSLTLEHPSAAFTFCPRFYQKGRNLPFYEPWTYRPWPGSVAGWCSWWPYRTEISEEVVEKVCRVFAERLRDFGFEYIQIDDGYQAGYGGLPGDWLDTNERFPGGLGRLVEIIRSQGLKPALWVNVHFGNKAFAEAHKDWFILDEQGELHKGPWLDYGLDGASREAVDNVVRPVYQALDEQGWDYVKIDTLRHLMYDAIYPCRAHYEGKPLTGEEAFRNILRAAREELGRDTFVLACWGVLPEAIGIADGCRLGTDGFGPTTLVQYNSFNNVVWRNDPDHMDITPEGEEIIRPVTVCMAGAMMLLTDKVEVYEEDEKIDGARRCAPVPFTLPGQLYDFDPAKTDNLKAGLRNDQGGGPPGPIDADQWGTFSPWWLLEINVPAGSWSVLARMSYTGDLPSATVRFEELGLPEDQRFAVYEFWTRKYLGVFEESFPALPQKAKEVRVFSLRPVLGRPQILSTSRHITQGWADLVEVVWDEEKGRLSGTSQVVRDDPYTLTLLLPAGSGYTRLSGAEVDGKAPAIRPGEPPADPRDGQVVHVTFHPKETRMVRWMLEFE